MPNLVIDLQSQGRYWMIAGVVLLFLFMHRQQIIGVIKPLLWKLREVVSASGPRPGWGWMLVLVMVILIWPGQRGESPLPFVPQPEVKKDLFARQYEVQRTLLAEALEQHAGQNYSDDKASSEAWNQRQQAVVEGSMSPFHDKMVEALSKGPEFTAAFARKLKAGELE